MKLVEPQLTRNHIPSVKSIVEFDEAKAIHELDFGDVASTILKVVLDIFLGHCRPGDGKSADFPPSL